VNCTSSTSQPVGYKRLSHTSATTTKYDTDCAPPSRARTHVGVRQLQGSGNRVPSKATGSPQAG
jgi:hypothetical protein